MKKLLLFLSVIFTFTSFATSNELLVPNPYEASFRKAYSLNPSIPKGILESVAFSQSRFAHLNLVIEPSCIGYPTAYGVMGLTEDGQSYFRNNLIAVSQLSGYSVEDIKTDPEKNILAYAKAFSILQQQKDIRGNNIANYKPIFIALSELPLTNDLQNDFALNTQLYQLYWFLSNGEFQDFYGFPDYLIDMRSVFGANYDVLRSSSVAVSPTTITNGLGNRYSAANISNLVASVDYGPALSNFTTCNYSSRSGVAISMVAIHDVEGTYAGCISWFNNCSSQVSAHYVARSSDGQITQMVLESNKAWHIGSENPYTLGIEHEGYNNNASWYTTAMLTSSADLVRDMCTDHGISPLRCYFGPGCSGTTQQCLQGTCVKIKGHQMFPNQTHDDPGPYWNWDKYYKLLNNTPTITTVTATAGSFYDSGSSGANYSNDERKLWLFQPAGATSVSMNFNSFNIENNYDYLFIYDGSTVNAPLIGKYTSTVSPGNINSTGSSLLIEFRSDCATTQPGWVATYTSNAVATNTVDNIAPTTQVNAGNAWDTTNFVTAFTDADAGGSGLDKSYYQVIDFNGTEWRGNYTHGFFSDNFDSAIHPEWTQKTGTWSINNNALQQTDEVSTAAGNTNIYASLTQNLSNRYLYNFKGKIDGTGTNRRAGFHFFVNDPDSVNRGNSYFVYFRLDQQRVQLYETSYAGGVNTFGSPVVDLPTTMVAGQWYDFKVIYDRITGKIDVYKDNTNIATWTDATPIANGGYISFRSGNCVWSLDEIKVYRSRPVASVNVSIGSGNANDVRYQNPSPIQNTCEIRSIVNDGAGNLSSIFYDATNIDWTKPSNMTVINDGLTADISTVVTSDSLSANWRSSNDVNSGIARYWYSIGTTPGAVNTLTWTSNWGDTTVTAKNLILTQGATYYFNVRSENGAGLFSNTISSNGQLLTTPTNTNTTTSINELTNENAIAVFPNPFNQTIEVSVNLPADSEVNLTLTDALGKEIVAYTTKESKGVYTKTIHTNDFNLSSGTYVVHVKYNQYNFTKKVIKQ